MKLPAELLEAMKRNGLQVRNSGNGIKRNGERLIRIDVESLRRIPLEDIPKYVCAHAPLYTYLGGEINGPIPERFLNMFEVVIVPFLLCRLEANDVLCQTRGQRCLMPD